MYTEKLFSYGMIQSEEIQISTYGRKLTGIIDILPGYNLTTFSQQNLDNTTLHPILTSTNNTKDEIIGWVFDVTPEELNITDLIDPKNYKRISVKLRSGIDAWVYAYKTALL